MAFLTFHILGRIIPTDEYFSEGSEGLKPPTRYTYTVDIHIDTHVDIHMLYIGIQKLANLQPTHKVIHKLHIFKAFQGPKFGESVPPPTWLVEESLLLTACWTFGAHQSARCR